MHIYRIFGWYIGLTTTEISQFFQGLIGILSIFVLMRVSRSLKEVREGVRREVVSSLFTQNAQLRGIIQETPRLRKYFFDGVSILRHESDYDRVRTIAEMYLNYLEHLMVEQRALDVDGQQKRKKNRHSESWTWVETAFDMLRRSPIMREVLENDPQWYAPQLTSIYRTVKEEIEKSNPTLHPNAQNKPEHFAIASLVFTLILSICLGRSLYSRK